MIYFYPSLFKNYLNQLKNMIKSKQRKGKGGKYVNHKSCYGSHSISELVGNKEKKESIRSFLLCFYQRRSKFYFCN